MVNPMNDINMDTTIIAAIIGLLGLFLGFLFNGIGYLLRERYKRIRVVNQFKN